MIFVAAFSCQTKYWKELRLKFKPKLFKLQYYTFKYPRVYLAFTRNIHKWRHAKSRVSIYVKQAKMHEAIACVQKGRGSGRFIFVWRHKWMTHFLYFLQLSLKCIIGKSLGCLCANRIIWSTSSNYDLCKLSYSRVVLCNICSISLM